MILLLLKKKKKNLHRISLAWQNNVLVINYSTDNRPGPKHFGKQLQMKHGTNNSLAWPVSLHMYHFILQHLELQAVSYFSSELVGGWVYEHCYDMYWEGNSNENGHETWGKSPTKMKQRFVTPILISLFTFHNKMLLSRGWPGLEITARQWTMSGLIVELTGWPFILPVVLTTHIRSYRKWNKLKFPCCSVVIGM